MHPIKTAAVLAALTVPALASAAILEIEPNDTLATAQPLGLLPPDADVGLFSLDVGDVDVLSIELEANDLITVNTSPNPPTAGVPDTFIALVDSTGLIVKADDDEGELLGSSFSFLADTAGLYYVAITGFPDGAEEGELFGVDGFTGGHSQDGDYVLTVSVIPVPEPTSLALAGLAGLGLVRRRK